MSTLQEMKEVIEAAIAGKTIQIRCVDGVWGDRGSDCPFNFGMFAYRVKPEPKPDVVVGLYVLQSCRNFMCVSDEPVNANLKLTFDGETGKLKSAEVLK